MPINWTINPKPIQVCDICHKQYKPTARHQKYCPKCRKTILIKSGANAQDICACGKLKLKTSKQCKVCYHENYPSKAKTTN